MNWIDKTIGYVSPEAALRRKTARSALEILAKYGAYRGAKKTRHTDNWVTRNSSANADLLYELDDLRSRSRDLVRNTPYAAKAVRTLASHMIGTGIIPRVKKAEGTEKVIDAWKYFADQCDFDGHTDFYGLQTLCARSKVESGEVLIVYRPAKSGGNLKVPLQLQVLEADHLDGQKNVDPLDNGGFIIQGVEFNKQGQRVAYWIFPRHPGDMGKRVESERIPADKVRHIYEKLRPGQVRGVPDFAPVMLKIKDLEDYDEAELISKRIQACFTAFITKIGGTDAFSGTSTESGSSTGSNERIETFRPAMVNYLNTGEDVKFGSPSLAQGYSEFSSVQLHAIAAGIGITYEHLTGDLSQVNYSSYRAGMLDFRQRNDTLRWQLWVPSLCKPIWNEFESYAYAAGRIDKDGYYPKWTPPRYESIDPEKDYRAVVMEVRAGLTSLDTAIAENGYDPDTVLDEISQTNKKLDQMGLVLDTDPRKINKTGSTQALESPSTENNNGNQ